MLILTRIPDILRHEMPPRLCDLINSDHATIIGPEGRYLRLGPAGRSLPVLDIDGADDDGPRAILILIDAHIIDRLDAVMRLCRLMKGLKTPDGRLTPGQRLRLRQMLQAVDADDHGASAPEIANVIFGRSRDKGRAWHESSFRFKVNRLIRDGRAMIAHGYRFLLRTKRKR